jgi:NAD(P)-dependent dehydrogenase (short-subunit alcohol dehydrogenase family)
VKIDGSVALVSGGASGLGEETVRHLHQQGAAVVVFDRDAARGEQLVAELGDRARFAGGDVLSEADTQAAVDAVTALGPLRIAVLCAGGARANARLVDRSGAPHDLALFAETVQLNLVGTFNTLRLAAAAMASGEPDEDGERGVAVTTASVAGYEGQIGQIAYGSAKAGLIGMTLIAARDLAVRGIRVNSIAPGTMATRAWDGVDDEIRDPLEAAVPFPRRFGRPSEFAELVEHLVTNRYINGHVVRLDGAIRFAPK